MENKPTNYNLIVGVDDIDSVVLKLSDDSICPYVEIRQILRKTGLIQIKTSALEKVNAIAEILNIEKDNKFYIQNIALI